MRTGRWIGAAVLCAVVAASAPAATLSVDVGATGQTVQTGWEAFTRGTGTTGLQVQDYATPMASAGTVTVELRQLNGFRDRVNTTHPIGDVVEDMAFGNPMLGFGLIGLKQGTYFHRSYHHDAEHDQGPIDVRQNDAFASSRLVGQNVPQTRNSGGQAGVVATVPRILHVGAAGTADLSWTKKGDGQDNAILSGFELTDAPPADLKVDIGSAGQTVQAGWQGFAVGSNTADTPSPKEHWYFTELGNQGSARVRLSAPSGMGYRDRSDVSHAIGDVLEDISYARNYGPLDVTLGSLQPGRYTITTYHHDTNFNRDTLGLTVDDAVGTGRAVAVVDQSAGANPGAIASATFEVIADGVNPIVVRTTGIASDIPVISGFEVTGHDALRVDFGSNGQEVQYGFQAFSDPNVGGYTPDGQTMSLATPLGMGGQVTVTLAASGGQLGFRDRGDVYNAELGDVSEDFVFDEAWLAATLTGLGQGAYTMTSYHADPGFPHGAVDVLVDDAAGIGRLVAENIVMPSSRTAPPGLGTYNIYSDGVNPIILRFQETVPDGGNYVMLGGFSVTQAIPEPGTMLTVALGVLGCGWRLRRRRR